LNMPPAYMPSCTKMMPSQSSGTEQGCGRYVSVVEAGEKRKKKERWNGTALPTCGRTEASLRVAAHVDARNVVLADQSAKIGERKRARGSLGFGVLAVKSKRTRLFP
jgi:hypothetical protein